MIIKDGYIIAIEKSDDNYAEILNLLNSRPTATDGFHYRLRADNLEWELVELPPVEEEPLTDEEALTRFSNTITGANDPDLISAAETLITDRIKEDSK